MQLRRAAAALTFLLLLSTAAAASFNITSILSKDPSLSTFNYYFTATGLAAEIADFNPITVCAVDNAAMAAFLSRRPSLRRIKRALSLHAVFAYLDAAFLHNLPANYPAAGTLYGRYARLQFFDLPHSDHVGVTFFGGTTAYATLVGSFFNVPYNFSVIQISAVLPVS